VPSQPEAAASSSSTSTALAVFGGTERAERRGWFLKKSKSDKPWSQVHHSHRYVVCRGHALSYYDGKVESLQAAGLRGVVDLREVRRLRPSADATAPEHALDLVLAGRTYVLVPQPATLEERQAWVSVWAQTLPVDAIAPALRPGNSFTAVDAPASGASAMDVDRFGAYEVPRVLMQGYMFKLPVRGGHRSTMSDLGGLLAGSGLPELAGWKRRFFLLRSGLLQWYRDDPANGESEFLGVLRLTPDTKVELEPEHVDARLKVTSGKEILLIKDELGAETVYGWEQALLAHVHELTSGKQARSLSEERIEERTASEITDVTDSGSRPPSLAERPSAVAKASIASSSDGRLAV